MLIRTIEEEFLERWFIFEASFGAFVESKREAFKKIALVYGITEEADTERLYELTEGEVVKLASNLSCAEMAFRLLELQRFKQANESEMRLSQTEYAVLAIKHHALEEVEEMLREESTIPTFATMVEALQRASNEGNITASGLLALALYCGFVVAPDRKKANSFVMKCLNADDVAGVLVALHFGGKTMQGKALWVLKGITDKLLINNPYEHITEQYKDVPMSETGNYIRT